MRYFVLYLLIGAIVAVWSAINNKGDASIEPALPPRARITSMLAAYALIAAAWPLSIALFVYALVVGLLTRERPERER
jgi:hypothetical protein